MQEGDRLLELLRVEFGVQDAPGAPLSEGEWAQVRSLASAHGVLGFVYGAISKLPEEFAPPRPIYLQFLYYADKIQRRNALLDAQSKEISEELSSLSLQSCILKGQGLAVLYPDPDLRQSGDIDVWVSRCGEENPGHCGEENPGCCGEGKPGRRGGETSYRRAIVRLLGEKWPVGKTFYHHVDVFPFGKIGTSVEVHFTPSWMFSPRTNRILQRYFAVNGAAQFGNRLPEKGFSVCTGGFNVVYGMVHLYRHLLLEGFGLRQLCDYYQILAHSSEDERARAAEVFASLGMMHFAAAIMFVLQEMFLLDAALLVCVPDPVRGRTLYREILRAGNFGKSDSRNAGLRQAAAVKRFLLKTARVLRYFPLAPSEAFFSPVFRAWQALWRVRNRDLFN